MGELSSSTAVRTTAAPRRNGAAGRAAGGAAGLRAESPRHPYQLGDVVTVVADQDDARLAWLLPAMIEWGLERLTHTPDADDTIEAVGQGVADLVLLDADRSDRDMSEILRDVRYSRIGKNPFLISITLMANPTGERVTRMLDAGVDFIVTDPLTPESVWARLCACIEARRPFVVVRDYVGPDRRKNLRAGRGPNTIEVPNTLGDKARGRYGAETARRAIASKQAEVISRWAGENAFRVLVLTHLIRGAIERHVALQRARAALEEIPQRLGSVRDILSSAGSPYAHDLCENSIRTIASIKKTGTTPNLLDVTLLQDASLALYRAFNPGISPEQLNRDIRDALRGMR